MGGSFPHPDPGKRQPMAACPGCGAELAQEARFCLACGRRAERRPRLQPLEGLADRVREVRRRPRGYGAVHATRGWLWYGVEAVSAWAATFRAAVAARWRLRRLRGRWKRLLLQLGDATYRGDVAGMRTARAALADLEQEAKRCRTRLDEELGRQRRRLDEERVAVQPTVVARVSRSSRRSSRGTRARPSQPAR
jgi:hypothetical protein